MRELPSRRQIEVRVTGAIDSVEQTIGLRVLRIIDQGVGVDRLPEAFWTQQEKEAAVALALLLFPFYQLAMGEVNRDVRTNELRARRLSAEHGRELAGDIVKGVRYRLAQAPSSVTSGGLVSPSMLALGVAASLRDPRQRPGAEAYGGPRNRVTTDPTLSAEVRGISAVTRLQSLAQLDAIHRVAEDLGILLVPKWFTQIDADGLPDEKVCPICEPLHEKLFHVWEERFPQGPPAHPRCRCYMTFVRARITNGNRYRQVA